MPMKKLRLERNDLRVESFDVRAAPEAERGTVRGHETYGQWPCPGTQFGECMPSYEVPCWWTGDPRLDCYAPSDVAPCTDYRC